MTTQDEADAALFEKIGTLIHGHSVDTVMPILLTFAARMLVIEASGDLDYLSTLLLKASRILQNEATDLHVASVVVAQVEAEGETKQ